MKVNCLKEEGFEKVGCMADHIEKNPLPPHVIITEELNVVETAHCDGVLGSFVYIYVFAYS